ncbi:MAG: hypothetical protein ACW99F_03915 [Candidatus Hodarchaeales archaeon]|jgi:hypothetical protein
MSQKTYLSILSGLALLLVFLVLYFTVFADGSAPSTPTESNSDFPVIYLALAIIGGMTIVLAGLLRLRK